jgi:hypothetical protein
VPVEPITITTARRISEAEAQRFISQNPTGG